MGSICLIRHGQSQWNLENRFTGWVDVDLSEKGIEEAKTAGERIADLKINWAVAHTSRLQRAQKTLDWIKNAINQPGLETWIDSALNERFYGDLQGMNKDEARKKWGEEQVHLWRRSFDVAPPSGECLADTAKRSLPYYREYILKEAIAGKNVLVVAHGNSLRSIIMDIKKWSPEEILKFEIATGVPYLYEFSNSGALIDEKVL